MIEFISSLASAIQFRAHRDTIHQKNLSWRGENLLRLAVNLRKLIMVLNNKMILYCFSPPPLLSRLLRRKANRCSATY